MGFTFLPREGRFFEYFEKASANLLEAARLQEQLFDGGGDRDELVRQITEAEHRGDFIVHEVMDLLPRTLLTPIDSEDIHQLTSAIDDAVDTIEETAANLQIYDIAEIKEPARKLARLITEGAVELLEAVKGLRDKKQYPRVHDRIVRINTIENSGDRVLRDAMRELVACCRNDGFDFVRWKDLYEKLEEATDRIEDAGDILQRVIIANA